MKNKAARTLLLGLAVLALAGLVVYSLRTNPQWKLFDRRAFFQSLVSVDKFWLACALLAVYATYGVRALRWKALMAPTKPSAGLWNIFSATVIGFGAIGLLGRAGEMVRPYLVARKEAVPVSSQLAVWFLERVFDMLTLLITVAFALARFEQAGLAVSPAWTRALAASGTVVAWTTLGMAALLAAYSLLAEHATGWLLGRLRFLPLRHFERAERAVLAFVQASQAIRRPGTLLVIAAWSVAEWVLIALCYGAVFNSFSGGLRLSFTGTLIFMGSVMAGSLIQVPALGGGIQAASLVVLTEVFAVRPEVAASISLLIWFFTFLAVVPPAVVFALAEGLSWSKLRRLEPEELK